MSPQTERSGAELLAEIRDSFAGIVALADDVERASAMIVASLSADGRVFFCGNGGSAADAQHLAAEFLGRFQIERRALPAVALTANSSAVTAIANDYGFEQVFARPLRGLARSGDVVVGISTSGRSANVVQAFEAAGEMGVLRIALTGPEPGPMSALAERCTRSLDCTGPGDAHRARPRNLRAGRDRDGLRPERLLAVRHPRRRPWHPPRCPDGRDAEADAAGGRRPLSPPPHR